RLRRHDVRTHQKGGVPVGPLPEPAVGHPQGDAAAPPSARGQPRRPRHGAGEAELVPGDGGDPLSARHVRRHGTVRIRTDLGRARITQGEEVELTICEKWTQYVQPPTEKWFLDYVVRSP